MTRSDLSKSELRRIEIREKILRNASRQFATYGYDGITMEKLAQSAKITKRTLYKHYPKKAQLYADSAAWHITQATNYTIIGNSAEERLCNYLKWLLMLVEKDVVYRRLIIQLIENSDLKTMKLISRTTPDNPVIALTRLIRDYNPKVDALKYSTAFFLISLLHLQSAKIMAVLTPQFKASEDKQQSIEFFLEMLN